MKIKILGALIGSLLICSSCVKKKFPKAVETKPEVSESTTATEETKAEVVEAVEPEVVDPVIAKGKTLYLSNCIQCHNRDPNVKGSIGPVMVDAPLEVMTSKVMTGKYPENLPAGFVPKRKTKAMRPIPKLKEDIPAIWAYVQSVKKSK